MGREAIYGVPKMLPIMRLTKKGNTRDKAGSCKYSHAISFVPRKIHI